MLFECPCASREIRRTLPRVASVASQRPWDWHQGARRSRVRYAGPAHRPSQPVPSPAQKRTRALVRCERSVAILQQSAARTIPPHTGTLVSRLAIRFSSPVANGRGPVPAKEMLAQCGFADGRFAGDNHNTTRSARGAGERVSRTSRNNSRSMHVIVRRKRPHPHIQTGGAINRQVRRSVTTREILT